MSDWHNPNMDLFLEYCASKPTSPIIEFGTGAGATGSHIASIRPDATLYTVDWYRGLPKTKKEIPYGSGWNEGAFTFPQQSTEAVLNNYPNVVMINTKIEDLESPETYGITEEIVGAHIDVDIYESSLSSLRYLKRLKWNEVYIRFDDWHGGEEIFNSHERQSLFDFCEENPEISYEIISDTLCGVVKLTR